MMALPALAVNRTSPLENRCANLAGSIYPKKISARQGIIRGHEFVKNGFYQCGDVEFISAFKFLDFKFIHGIKKIDNRLRPKQSLLRGRALMIIL